MTSNKEHLLLSFRKRYDLLETYEEKHFHLRKYLALTLLQIKSIMRNYFKEKAIKPTIDINKAKKAEVWEYLLKCKIIGLLNMLATKLNDI